MPARIERTLEERIESACKNVLLRIPEHLHCEDLYQDIACIYLEIYSKNPDYKHAVICNRIYSYYVNKLIRKYSNNECNYIVLPNSIEDEDDMMFMITDIFGAIRDFVTEREFGIICEKFIDNKTFEYMDNEHCVNRGRTRQIIDRAIRRIRRRPKCKDLIKDFYR